MGSDAFAGRPGLALHDACGEQTQRIAQQRAARNVLHVCQQAAGTLCHGLGRCIGGPHQCGGNGGLAFIESMGGLAEQRAAQGVDADDFSAKRHQIQVSLENFAFLPLCVQCLGRNGLAHFLHQAAPALVAAQVRVQKSHELHGQGGSAPGLLVPQIAPGCGAHGFPVHAAVFVETLVFAEHHGSAQRG